MPRPASGYAYRGDERVNDRNFRRVPDDAWKIVMLCPERGPDAFVYLGRRWIDGCEVNVWRYPDAGYGGPFWYAQPVAGC